MTTNPERIKVRSLSFKVSRDDLLEELKRLGYKGPTSYTKTELATIIGCLSAGEAL